MTDEEQSRSGHTEAPPPEPPPPEPPGHTAEQIAAEEALARIEDRSGAFTSYTLAADFLELREIYAGSLERVKEESWAKRTSDRRPNGWTLWQTLAHMDAVAQLYNAAIELGLAGRPVEIAGFTRREDLRAMNQAAMDARAELPVAELCASFLGALEESARLAGRLEPGQLGFQVPVPFYGATPTLAELFGGSLSHAGIVHGAQMSSSHEHPIWHFFPPGLMRRQLTRFFHVLGLVYWPERGHNLHATIGFSAEGQGGGSWMVRAHPSGGKGNIGIARTTDVAIRFASADLLCRVVTGSGLPWRQIALRQVRVSGNLRLAMRLPALFKPT